MMKYLIIILSLFFTCVIFQDHEILSYEYNASTRGLLMKVKIRKDSTFIFEKGRATKILTKESVWESLKQQTIQLDLGELESFKAPTEDRFIDKALSAQLKVISKNHTYYSSEFDHGNPPEELKSIVKSMTSYLESE